MSDEIIYPKPNKTYVRNGRCTYCGSKKIKTKLGTRGEVVSKKVLKKSIKKSKIIIEVFVKVKEDITDNLEIIETKE